MYFLTGIWFVFPSVFGATAVPAYCKPQISTTDFCLLNGN